MMAACLACGDGADVGRYVFASRHGEMTRTLSIMQSLAASELPSPADFSLSVHNALAGLLSIHAGNRAGHTALAAGPDTFGYALVEAQGLLAEQPGKSVLVCYGDDVLPGAYSSFKDDDVGLPMVAALLLTAAGQGTDAICQTAAATDALPISHVSLAAEFLAFLLRSQREHVAVGQDMTWRWRRVEPN